MSVLGPGSTAPPFPLPVYIGNVSIRRHPIAKNISGNIGITQNASGDTTKGYFSLTTAPFSLAELDAAFLHVGANTHLASVSGNDTITVSVNTFAGFGTFPTYFVQNVATVEVTQAGVANGFSFPVPGKLGDCIITVSSTTGWTYSTSGTPVGAAIYVVLTGVK